MRTCTNCGRTLEVPELIDARTCAVGECHAPLCAGCYCNDAGKCWHCELRLAAAREEADRESE